MKKSRIIYISSSTLDFNTSKFRREYGIDSFPLLKKRNIFYNIILFFGFYLFDPLLFLVYGEWKYRINDYDVLILDTRRPSKFAVKMIKRKKKRLILFYWNIISNKELQPNYLKKYSNEIYTFDIKDSRKYNIKFNDTCIYDKILDKFSSDYEANSAYYLGVNKEGREEILENLYSLLSRRGTCCKFNLVGSKNRKFKAKPMKYEEYLICLSKSKYVVEIVSKGQSGLTLRSVEALYYGKKLITNNETIKTFPLYDDSRVLIISQINRLDDFLKSDFVGANKDLIDYYCFEKWLERLIGEKIE